MKELPKEYLAKLKYQFIEPNFPNVSDTKLWKDAFKPCASQRIFFPVNMIRSSN